MYHVSAAAAVATAAAATAGAAATITSALAASFLNTIAMANASLDTPGRRRVFCVNVERAKAHALDHWVVGDRPNQWSLPFAELSR